MKNKTPIVISLAVAIFLLISAAVFAQEEQGPKDDCGCAPEVNVVKDDDLGRWVEESALCYEAEDGNLYWWLSSDNDMVKSYEERGDEEGLLRYLHEIAGRYSFSDESSEQGFVEWSLKNRPWSGE
jgi:hypothetical protein